VKENMDQSHSFFFTFIQHIESVCLFLPVLFEKPFRGLAPASVFFLYSFIPIFFPFPFLKNGN